MNKDNYASLLPARILRDTIYCDRIIVNKTENFTFVFTKQFTIFEIKDHSIINSVQLTGIDHHLLNITPNLLIYRTRHGSKRQLFLLLLINRSLFVIKRSCSKLLLKETFENVDDVKIVDNGSGPKVVIKTPNRFLAIVTDFSSESPFCDADESTTASASKQDPHFKEIIACIREKNSKAKAELKSQMLVTKEFYDKYSKKLRFLPNHLRTENEEEKVALAKYGDIWTRVHNNFIIFGIALLNCTYKRQLVVERLCPTLHCTNDPNITYSAELYKLQNDCYTFENFQQLFDNEDKEVAFQNFDHEWVTSDSNSLSSEQTGIIILKTELKNFIEHPCYDFHVFVDYDIEHNETISTHQLYSGKVKVDATVVMSEQCWPSFKTTEVFKDLLAIKAASMFIALLISFQNDPVNKIADYIEDNLKFSKISKTALSDEQMLIDNVIIDSSPSNPKYHEIFYQRNDGFMKGVLIRLDSTESLSLKIKIYARQEQIIMFVRSLYEFYPEVCEILPFAYVTKTSEQEVMKWKSSLLDEIMCINRYHKSKISEQLSLEEMKKFRAQLSSLELKTDLCSGSCMKYNK